MSAAAPLSPGQRRQLIGLTLGAVAVFAVFRWLPTGTNLSHGDFRLEGDNVLEFCDPAAPQFLPVTTARSPVIFEISPASVATGAMKTFTLRLATSSGKPIGPVDLLVAHTRKLHVMVVDPTLRDYQHVHPEPTATAGEWTVSFAPRLAGAYRIFADFTPAATARGLYASAELTVPGDVAVNPIITNWTAEVGSFRFELRPDALPVRARETTRLTFAIRAADGADIALGEVMGAFAHLVAFDRERSGFAHLHPLETDLAQPPSAAEPDLHFQVTIPDPGLYVIWAQLVLDGTETFVPFWFEVEP
ncbi:hypothetical protein [Synoicihabitans lomoniglobus]|uniref:YtkA-like domain-containing protein n=1 Tax=Synoicihabitans lomoniglobus TaxID=2909285 RepID=A0AAE9ZZ18_9BACT|nr:hypothetical protein [Opitutaceae bacterium LMO-M01]WED63082.1 hypothetical protein PXH66_12140 [Opitutaceae bacterium LMO-M01]